MTRLYFSLIVIFFAACSSESGDKIANTNEEPPIVVPTFNADSAYYHVTWQVEAGPRVPGTDTHKMVGDMLVEKLESYGAKVIEQRFQASTYDGNEVELRNIIGEFFPERNRRLLLAAHWDTRPFADKDPISKEQPIDGANDGASGIAVLLEIARQLSISAPPSVGVDIIFFDGEDWGERQDGSYVATTGDLESWWCLGSQYWSRNKHKPNYAAYYGILLDMVGAKDSQFHKEGLSQRMAPKVVNKIWDRAKALGYGGIFVNKKQAEILDDHKFVNELGKIPMVNIVHYDPEEGYFGDYHHSLKDNIDLIDPKMLGIVGNTVLHVIFYE